MNQRVSATDKHSESEICPLCHSGKLKPVEIRKREGLFIRCGGCGLVFKSAEIAERQEEIKYYEQGYYEAMGNQSASIHQSRQAIYAYVLKEAELYRKTGRILDIGCGYGDFLKLAQEQGWEGWGIEPSQQACSKARDFLNNRIIMGSHQQANFSENTFDVITLINVVDSLPDPEEVLKLIRCWLTPEGVLLIRTPNTSFHLILEKTQNLLSDWNLFHPKKPWSLFLQHNFSPRAMHLMLRRVGFEKVSIGNSKLTPGDPYKLLKVSAWVNVGKMILNGWFTTIAFLTGGHALVGPSLFVKAYKTEIFYKKKEYAKKKIKAKRSLLYVCAFMGYFLGLPYWLRRLGGDRQARVLLYHSVLPGACGDLNVMPEDFAAQMDFLARRFLVVPLDGILRLAQKGEEFYRKPFAAITFDDGYASNYHHAFPILKQKGLPAAVFVLSKESENLARKVDHLTDELFYERDLLTWNQAREMAQSGITFGSHGKTHRRLDSKLSLEELRDEIQSSKIEIEKQVNQPVKFFAFPYGKSNDYSSKAKEMVQASGYEACFLAIPGFVKRGDSLFEIRRIGIEASDTLFTLKAKLNGAMGIYNFLIGLRSLFLSSDSRS